jgi:hypothetical protein
MLNCKSWRIQGAPGLRRVTAAACPVYIAASFTYALAAHLHGFSGGGQGSPIAAESNSSSSSEPSDNLPLSQSGEQKSTNIAATTMNPYVLKDSACEVLAALF